jgi:hypothetical protein
LRRYNKRGSETAARTLAKLELAFLSAEQAKERMEGDVSAAGAYTRPSFSST